MQEILNLDQVCTIKVFPHCLNKTISYRQRTINNNFIARLLGRTPETIDIYSNWGDVYKSGEQLNKWLSDRHSFIDRDKEVYYYPHLEIWFSNNHCRNRYFGNPDKLYEELEIIKSKIPNILITEKE